MVLYLWFCIYGFVFMVLYTLYKGKPMPLCRNPVAVFLRRAP